MPKIGQLTTTTNNNSSKVWAKVAEIAMRDLMIYGKSGELLTKWDYDSDKIILFYKAPDKEHYEKIEV